MFGLIKKQLEKIREYFERRNSESADDQGKRIVIRARNDHGSTGVQGEEIEVDPKITIRGVNKRVPIVSGDNIYSGDLNVPNKNIGRGITVKKQRKPVRCPICATRGGIIENPGGDPRWKCPACNETFN